MIRMSKPAAFAAIIICSFVIASCTTLRDKKQWNAQFKGPQKYAAVMLTDLKENFERLGLPGELAYRYRIQAKDLDYAGENDDGPYSEKYGGVHGANYSSPGSWRTKVEITPNRDGSIGGKVRETIQHEMMHTVVTGYLRYPTGFKGYTFEEGRGNYGHPEYIISPDGTRYHVPTVIAGRWPSMWQKFRNLVTLNGWMVDDSLLGEAIFDLRTGQPILIHTIEIEENDQ